jgi:hypothetical protein
MTHIRNLTAALIAGAMYIAVVLSPVSTAGAAPARAACSLLTQAQVGAVLGVSVAAGQPFMPGDTGQCMWSQLGRPAPSERRVLLFLQEPLFHDGGKKPLAGSGITIAPATGIGDDAYFDTTPGQGIGLHVKKGSAAFTVRVYGFPEDQIRTKERTLAQNILTKL